MVFTVVNTEAIDSICVRIVLDNHPRIDLDCAKLLLNHSDLNSTALLQENCLNLSLDDVLRIQHSFGPNLNITVLLQQGNHTPNNVNQLHIAKHTALSLSGNGSKENITLKGVRLVLSEIKNIELTNFTVEDSILNVYGVKFNDPYAHTTITVENCKAMNTQIILTDTIIFIKDSEVSYSKTSAITSYSSFLIFVGNVCFLNNMGKTGGALNLRGSRMKVNSNANVVFKNNNATEFGGALFVDNADLYISSEGYNSFCFYFVEQVDSNYSVEFIGNEAKSGGDHIYGAAMKTSCTAAFRDNSCAEIFNCGQESYEILTQGKFKFENPTMTLSAISGSPTRVCVCNSDGQPQCTDVKSILYELSLYPGEHFAIPVVIVGGDFGTTIGTVYAHHNISGNQTMHEEVITQNKNCTYVKYCFDGNTNHKLEVYLTTEQTFNFDYADISRVNNSVTNYTSEGIIDKTLLHMPIVLNITFTPCPPGFILLKAPVKCGCYPQLDNVHCKLKDRKGYISWNSSLWMNAIYSDNMSGIITTKNCPFGYCKHMKSNVNLGCNPDAQCTFNRAGRLCGKCKKNYSLAIGSSHCIHCPNNTNLALLILFVVVGPLLVFFISALNLTVTQGTINGLIFYANIVWAYQSIFFPPNTRNALLVFKPFVAWLNLDFGIEVCFYKGLDAFSKTWLQFVFPIYTATLFFIGLKFSSNLSKLLGSRSVPTLATLLVLSYTKLLRTIIAGLQLASLTIYTQLSTGTKSTVTVWALDGNLTYGHYPHIFLLFVVLACLVLLWIPYTLVLFSMQWLRKIDHYQPLKLIARYKPVYDAYFAPLKDKHHYWFGVLLLAQGTLLLTSSLLLNVAPILSLLFLLIVTLLMLCYLNFMKIYKRITITLLEGSFYINLILLTAGMLYLKSNEEINVTKQEILLSLSIAIAFIKFCIIVTLNIAPQKFKVYCNRAEKHLQLFKMESIHITREEESDDYEERYRRYRDSVLK